jgi:hypothetical protein
MIHIEVRKNQALLISNHKAIIKRINRTKVSKIVKDNKIVINSTQRTNNLNNFIISIKIFSKTQNTIKNNKAKNKSKLSTKILFTKI